MSTSILLIEDDQWLAESYQHTLAGYEVTVASSGQAAMNLLDDKQFDLIIADVMLEGGSVIDLLHELQSYDDTMTLPIILCTSLASSLRLADMQAYGVVALLDKAAVTPDSLRVAVQQALHTGKNDDGPTTH